jgi:uncharacterized membrane protein
VSDEKQEEKLQEKEVQKREEKMEEKWHQDPLSAVVGALILIWAGVVLLAANLGLLDAFVRLVDLLPLPLYELPFEIPFFGASAWRLFFLGAGVIVLFEVLIRLIVPQFRRRIFGSLIGAIVLIALGFGNFEVIWPLILIAIGASILLGGLFTRRKL